MNIISRVTNSRTHTPQHEEKKIQSIKRDNYRTVPYHYNAKSKTNKCSWLVWILIIQCIRWLSVCYVFVVLYCFFSFKLQLDHRYGRYALACLYCYVPVCVYVYILCKNKRFFFPLSLLFR